MLADMEFASWFRLSDGSSGSGRLSPVRSTYNAVDIGTKWLSGNSVILP